MNAPHPGPRLSELLLQHGVTSYACAQAIGEPPSRIYELAKLKRPVTPLLALRLARYFGTTADEWLLAQAHYQLSVLPQQVLETVEKIRPVTASIAKESA